MNQLEAIEAANRAADAVCRSRPKDGGWLAEANCQRDMFVAAGFVRCHPEAPAEALYLQMRRDASLDWLALEARKRAAFELFRAGLLVLDKLVAIDEARRPPIPTLPTAYRRSDYLLDQDDEMSPSMDDQERLR